MDIPSPPGYGAVVPLDKQRHKGLGVKTDAAAAWARPLHLIYINVQEFFQASRSLPVVFGRERSGALVPVMITGVEEGRNLFVTAEGIWDPAIYCPAYVRRYPFLTATIRGAQETQALVCVDEEGLTGGVPPLFDTAGNDTARWREFERLIRDVDQAQQQTTRLCQRLVDLDLLETFEADLHPRQAPRRRLTGLLRVKEQRLNDLAGETVRELMQSGLLSRVYAHLMSLENFSVILDRYALGQTAS